MTADPAAEEWHTGSVRFTSDAAGANEELINPATGTTEWSGVRSPRSSFCVTFSAVTEFMVRVLQRGGVWSPRSSFCKEDCAALPCY
jgi:hypothetical protein